MTLLGHDAAWREWHKAMAGDRMHHAWLLAGRRGVGKATFALAAARELVGADGQADQHPDIHVLSFAPKESPSNWLAQFGFPKSAPCKIG